MRRDYTGRRVGAAKADWRHVGGWITKGASWQCRCLALSSRFLQCVCPPEAGRGGDGGGDGGGGGLSWWWSSPGADRDQIKKCDLTLVGRSDSKGSTRIPDRASLCMLCEPSEWASRDASLAAAGPPSQPVGMHASAGGGAATNLTASAWPELAIPMAFRRRPVSKASRNRHSDESQRTCPNRRGSALFRPISGRRRLPIVLAFCCS
jgi:hypothetical protein